MENTEIVANEEVMEVVNAVENNGVGTVLILASAMTFGAFAWSKILKPVGRKIKTKIASVKAAKQNPENYENCVVEEIPTKK